MFIFFKKIHIYVVYNALKLQAVRALQFCVIVEKGIGKVVIKDLLKETSQRSPGVG